MPREFVTHGITCIIFIAFVNNLIDNKSMINSYNVRQIRSRPTKGSCQNASKILKMGS